MRDSDRIPKILHEIERIWQAFPDLRLGQLLLNAVRDPALYYIEDEELVHRLLENAYNYAKETIDGEA